MPKLSPKYSLLLLQNHKLWSQQNYTQLSLIFIYLNEDDSCTSFWTSWLLVSVYQKREHILWSDNLGLWFCTLKLLGAKKTHPKSLISDKTWIEYSAKQQILCYQSYFIIFDCIKKQTKKQQNLCETINFNKSSFLTKGEQCIVSKNLTPVNFNVDLTHA